MAGRLGWMVAAAGVAGVVAARRAAGRAARQLDAAPRAGWDMAGVDGLPAPVARYLRLALPGGPPVPRVVTLAQRGVVRGEVADVAWMPFRATHRIWPAAGFVWDARIRLAPGVGLHVQDALVGGVGQARVTLGGLVPMARERGGGLDEGALHRFLAEAVWAPWALLPAAGVRWEAVDDHAAIATLARDGQEVALTFRFDDDGFVAGVHTDGRLGRFGDGYARHPWKGRFEGRIPCGGAVIPRHGAVGWTLGGRHIPVWRAEIAAARA